jgi:hypothetical protein
VKIKWFFEHSNEKCEVSIEKLIFTEAKMKDAGKDLPKEVDETEDMLLTNKSSSPINARSAADLWWSLGRE